MPYIDAEKFLSAIEAAAIKAGIKLVPDPSPMTRKHRFRLWRKEKKSSIAEPTIIEQLVSKSSNGDAVNLPLSYREACIMRVALQSIRLNIITQIPGFKNKDTLDILDHILTKIDRGIKSGAGDKK